MSGLHNMSQNSSELKCCKRCDAYSLCDHRGECCPECAYYDAEDNLCMAVQKPRVRRERREIREEPDPDTFLFEEEEEEFEDFTDEDEEEDYLTDYESDYEEDYDEEW